MLKLKLIVSVAALGLITGGAYAQSNTQTVVETLPNLSKDVVRAKFIRPGDVSPEEYQALLDEADRVKAYKNQQHLRSQPQAAGSQSIASSYVTRTYSSNVQTPPTRTNFHTDSRGYQIELYDTPQVQTVAKKTAALPIIHDQSNTHYVVRGDTLYNIAKRNNISVSELKSANYMTDNTLSQGQTLIVPIIINPAGSQTRYEAPYVAPVTTVANKNTRTVKQPRKRLVRNVEPVPHSNVYRVLPKDTVYSISRSACVSVIAMQRLNQINNPGSIQPGQKLQLPAGHCLK